MGRVKYQSQKKFLGRGKIASKRRSKQELLESDTYQVQSVPESSSCNNDTRNTSAGARKLSIFGIQTPFQKEEIGDPSSEQEECYLFVQKSVLASMFASWFFMSQMTVRVDSL